MNDKGLLTANIDKIHTTEMGVERIKRNLKWDAADVVECCKNLILDGNCHIIGRVKIGTVKMTIIQLYNYYCTH